MTRTCATCPLAEHIDRDRFICHATHNHHSTQVVRGHWQATIDCEGAIAKSLETIDVEATEVEKPDSADAGYVMQLEAALEKVEVRAIQQQQFSEVAAVTPPDIENDKALLDWLTRLNFFMPHRLHPPSTLDVSIQGEVIVLRLGRTIPNRMQAQKIEDELPPPSKYAVQIWMEKKNYGFLPAKLN